MEHIRQAIERAKAGERSAIEPAVQQRATERLFAPGGSRPASKDAGERQIPEVVLGNAHLENHRIVAHDIADPRSKAFDMLRTQVLQSLDRHRWQLVGVTSPTAACGKTSTAVNLALSIARQPDRAVLLIDLDLQRPQVANCLGLRTDCGVLSVLEGQKTLSDAVVHARARQSKIVVLPAEAAISGSSEWMTSRAMTSMMQTIKREFARSVVVVDLPPMLSCDDVIALLPQLDCLLFVTAAGTTTVAEVEECTRHLQSSEVVRVVVNKVPEEVARYY
jgi:Mrp family chromosome partitioning ATPase